MLLSRVARQYALPIAIVFLSSSAFAAGVDGRVHIDNFGQVSSTYYRGAQPKGHDYADLAGIGVKTIVNLEGDDADTSEPTLAAQAGLKYVNIPMTTSVAPTKAQIDQFLSVVDDPANQPVYVHCVGGKHRTGTMTAVYRITQEGWAADKAFQEMKTYHFGADFLHPALKAFVLAFHAPLAAGAQ